ncbi:hypothetical protein [Aequorivita lipolytica]|uniref:Uncharacterized protein n=1 Tax=Aequorivita lipolytica TaxID=153267 RepID=A0A5C6YR27_9FLAO|nr:hypothetical protein [Aequorivita lipolytica]TXD69312.1 hypothetical protein ESV24_08100 [Aequorivita lipolytica]SRX50065.1 hypothetical protein AEQU2_00531 [Aequorivita lipolytica]
MNRPFKILFNCYFPFVAVPIIVIIIGLFSELSVLIAGLMGFLLEPHIAYLLSDFHTLIKSGLKMIFFI